MPIINDEHSFVLEFGLLFEIPLDALYIWDCRTHEAFHNIGLYKYGLSELNSLKYQYGKKRLIIHSDKTNTVSISAIRSVGFEKTFQFSLIKIGNKVVVLNKTHLEIVPHNASINPYHLQK